MTTTNHLADPPAWKGVDKERLGLLKAVLNARSDVALNDTDIASGLELAQRYDLDLFAGEAWILKSQKGRVSLMVGRDGLRKIASQNGLRAERDYVCEQDTFMVTRDGPSFAVKHEYGLPSARGPIAAAYCAVYDGEGVMRGWFLAMMSEFKPRSENKLKFSPWGAQESVMIVAAAERQALSQACPLGGLLVEGETARNEEQAALPGTEIFDVQPATIEELWAMVAQQQDDETADRVSQLVTVAADAGHAGLADTGTIAMRLDGWSGAQVKAWLDESWEELRKMQEDAEPEPPAGGQTTMGEEG